MDSIFLLDDEARTTFLQHMLHSFGCTYICLWSYFPQPSNCLISVDGLYIQENNQPSSSPGSHARKLFDEYRQAVFILENDGVPGLAFKSGVPYMELKEVDILTLASVEPQLQFYQEARIKIAIFMGCNTGEIELGISNYTQINLEMEMKNWFPHDFSRQLVPLPTTDQSRPSSSSSSLRSLSMGSPEVSPFLFNIPNTSSHIEPPIEAQVLRLTSTSTSPPLHQAANQPFNQIPTFQFTALLETKEVAGTSQNPSAFRRFQRSALGPSPLNIPGGIRRPNIQKRAITFFRSLRLMRMQGQMQGSRPMTSTQLHHMISERRRRERLNESFQTLRSLLPPGTKKDKASVLSSTAEYLASLKSQVQELTQRSKDLQAKILLLTTKEEAKDVQEVSLSSNERVAVRITYESESTSETQRIVLEVMVRGECNMLDLVMRILEFFKQAENAILMSVEADAQVVNSNPINIVRMRLRIEGGGEWDESAFQEAVRRVVADMAQ